MDEPTAHLDPGHQVAVGQLVHRLVSEGKGVIAAVHDLNLASAIAGRAILLKAGRLILDGPTESVLRNPALDETYQTRFERIRTESGRLIVLPSA